MAMAVGRISMVRCILSTSTTGRDFVERDGVVGNAKVGLPKLSIGHRLSVTGGRGRRRPRVGPAVTVVRAMRASGGDRKEEKRIVENIPSSPPPPSTTTNSVGVEDQGIEKDDQLADEAVPSEAGMTESQNSEGKQEEISSTSSADSIEEIGSAISELRKERAAMGLQDSASTTGFWKGVAEETKLIDWPVFSKVLGTTGVVVAMILGSSVVLLTVNAVLAASSDFIFNDPAIKEFAKNQLNLSF
ncbi:unnamed protein product [Calypogeia fissa]